MTGRWIETKVEGRLVLEQRAKDFNRSIAEAHNNPDAGEGGWILISTFRQTTSVEEARNSLPEDDEYDFRLVYERTETKREDVTE